MKRTPIIILVILVALAGAGWWFWSLGASPTNAQTTITLHDVKGDVQIGTNGTFTPAHEGQTANAGETVRTGSDGQVSVDFFHQGETRLAAHSTLVIGSDTTNSDDTGILAVHLQLDNGHIWTRVRQLLNLNSSYTVTTDQVVATVRGTAFDLAKNDDGSSSLLVTHSVVSGNDGLVPEGYEQTFGSKTAATSTPVRISNREWNTAWIRDNQKEDTQTLKRWQQEDKQELDPGHTGILGKLAVISTGLHGLAAHEDVTVIGEKTAQQELATIHDLALQGNTSAAEQELTNVHAQLAKIDVHSDEAQTVIRRLLPRMQRLFDDINENDPGYSIKQAVQQLLLSIDDDPTANAFQQVLQTNQRLDAALDALTNGNADRARGDMTRAQAVIDSAMKAIPTNLPPAEQHALELRWQAAQLRLHNLPTIVPAQTSPGDTPIVPPEDNGKPTSSTSDVQPLPPKTLLTVMMKPPLTQPLPNITPTSSTMFRATTSPPLSPPPTPIHLVSLTVQSIIAAVSTGSETASLHATAVYSDGSKQDVTDKTKFSSKDTTIAVVQGNQVSAGQQGGTTTLTGMYQEGDIIVTGSTDFTVEIQHQPAP